MTLNSLSINGMERAISRRTCVGIGVATIGLAAACWLGYQYLRHTNAGSDSITSDIGIGEVAKKSVENSQILRDPAELIMTLNSPSINGMDRVVGVAPVDAVIIAQSLNDAINNNNIVAVAELLAAGTDVNLQEKNGSTALMIAAQRGHTIIIKLLLAAARANVNLQEIDGYTALMWAARNGHTEIVKLLLAAARANVNLQERNGYTALTLAVSHGRTEIIKLLLAAGADVNLQKRGGDTALMLAASDGRTEIIKLLLAAGANVNLQKRGGDTALMLAAFMGYTEVIKLLLATEANVNLQEKNGHTALIDAVYMGHTEVVKLLLATGANVNLLGKDGATALMSAAQRFHTKIVRLLLVAGADVNLGPRNADLISRINVELAKQEIEFLTAVESNDLATINELIKLQMHAEIASKALPLFTSNDLEIRQYKAIATQLLAHGANINYAILVDTGAAEGKGADIPEPIKEPRTALDFAILQNQLKRVEFLLANGADPLKLSPTTMTHLASFIPVTPRYDKAKLAVELTNMRAQRYLDMAYMEDDITKNKYLDHAFKIAEIIDHEIVHPSLELNLMAREDKTGGEPRTA
jgi:ankyrin repeat protein